MHRVVTVSSARATDLSNCDVEPIHVPGSVQAHGFLLVVDPANVVRMVSENAAGFLDRPLSTILDQPLTAALPEPWGERLLEAVAREQPGISARFLLTLPRLREHRKSLDKLAAERDEYFEVVAHRSGELLLLEFECAEALVDGDSLSGRLYDAVTGFDQQAAVKELSQNAVEHLRALTGFDRVLLYNFEEDGSGTVLAESRNEALPSYLDLRFPASDVPRQARRLYELNRVRIIPDVQYTPSPIEGEGAAALDLSGSVLRSVSPIHREYMRNMGTMASMSISILIDGRLWGLISLHHKHPRLVPYRLRSYCDLLTQVYSSHLSARLKQAELTRAIELKQMETQLLTSMTAGPNYLNGLVSRGDDLLRMMGAQGGALVIGTNCILLGQTPPERAVLALTEWLAERGQREVYTSSYLSQEYPPAAEWAEVASGLMAVSLSRIHRSYFFWFRQELVRTVRWAGEPVKQETLAENGRLEIHPRRSFALWSETVRHRSANWSRQEIAAAGELRAAILEVVLKRAEEMAELVTELEFANKELEAFSYSVSHDLRAPFRHISGFSELLLEEEAERLDEKGIRYIRKIMESARFAGLLVDTLLNFSRIARSRIEMRPVDMHYLAEEQWRETCAEECEGRMIQFACTDLPMQIGDVTLLRQVFRNLYSNAIKYTRATQNARVRVSFVEQPEETVFCVEDNGVGFDQTYAHKLFGVFQRLHRTEDFEGTGIGLANIRRIISRHGGSTWAEGKLGEGAKFFFSLPRREHATEGK